MHHGGHVQFAHLFIDGIPRAVGERRRGPVPAGGIGIQVAADEAQFVDAALEFRDAVRDRHTRRLRHLAHADEILRVERHHAGDQIVAYLRPFDAGPLGADVVGHGGGARRKDGEVGAAVALEFELGLSRRSRATGRRSF